MIAGDALSKDYERSEADYDPRSVGIVGEKLKAEREIPVGSAFSRQERAISELEMTLERLEQKLQVISSDQTRDQGDNTTSPRSGASQLVRTVDELTDRIQRQTRRVVSMTEGLEI